MRITAYLERFYEDDKNSCRLIYTKIFIAPRNHSI